MGDEYSKIGEKRNYNKEQTTASYEIYRSLDSLSLESKLSIQQAINDSLLSGPLLGYPMVNVKVEILDGRWSNIRSKSPLIFQMCSA